MQVFKRIYWFINQEKKYYAIGILALALIAFLNLVPPKIMGHIIDLIIKQELDKKTLFLNVALLLLIAVIIYVLRNLWRIYIFGTSYKLEKTIRSNLFAHFTTMSPDFYQRYRTGDLMAHATVDIKSVQRVAANGILQFADALLTGIFVLVAMIFTISYKLTIVALLPMPIIIFGSRILGKKLHETFLISQEAFSNLNNRVHESISGVKVTKTFGLETEEINKFRKESEIVYQKNMKVTKYDTLFDPMIIGTITLSHIFILALGFYLIKIGEISTGDLSAFVSYIHILVWPMMAIGFLFNTLERGNASLDRIENILNEKEDIVSYGQDTSIEHNKISFEVDEFKYPNDTQATLKDIRFELLEGQTLGVIGKTGSGKSTLIKLLLREYDTYEGSIKLDNTDIRKLNLYDYREETAYVPQDDFLFSMTLLDNISFGKPNASLEEVINVSKLADVHHDIINFNDKYDTLIGEKGQSLSGGQKQRVSIARALLLDAKILILDDALSAVDAKTETKILKNLKDNRQDKTTIILAHRLSAVKHADLIIVLDDGEIIERGNHDSLMKQDGWYKMIYTKQEFMKELQDGK